MTLDPSDRAARRRRLLIVTVAVLQLALFAAFFAWRAAEWNRKGWAGLSFTAGLGLEQNLPLQLPDAIQAAQGAVLVVVPGSPAARAGIAAGDLVISVDTVDPGAILELWQLERRKKAGDSVVYALQTDDGERQIAVELVSPLGDPKILLAMVSSFLVGAAFLAISLLVCWARPRSRSALVFFLMSSVGSALFFLWSASELDLVDLRGILPMGVNLFGWGVLAVFVLLSQVLTNLLLHLSLVFPRPRPITASWPAVFRWLHTAPFFPFVASLPAAAGLLLNRTPLWLVEFVGIALAVPLLIRLARHRRANGLKQTLRSHPVTLQLLAFAVVAMIVPAGRLLPRQAVGVAVGAWILTVFVFLLVVLTLYSVLTCGAFVRSYREAGREARLRVRWPLWGTVVALVGTTLLAAFTLVVGFGPSGPTVALWAGLLTKLLYLLIPVSFAFGILRYRLMEIDVIIRKTFVYAGVTAFVVAGYLVLVGGLGLALVSWAGVDNQAVTVISTLAIAALLIPVKNRIQGLVDHRFARGEERREVEFSQALEIQKSLLPERIPEHPGLEIAAHWQPAREMAGDYYDVLALPGGALAICIGDVVGKGMPAALLMSSLQAAVKAVAPQEREPRRVCAQVRDVVCQNLTGGKFVTFFYGRIEERRLTFTNAGHNPPILLHADGRVRRLAEGGGVMARFLRHAPLAQGEVELGAGDRLVLFTDGVSEARPSGGEDFGEDRLVEVLQRHAGLGARELCERIVSRTEEFAGGEPEDDLTLLVVAVGAS